MEIIQIIRVLLRRWYLVIIPIAVVGVFTVPELISPPPTQSSGYTTVIRYSASQVLEAIPERDGDYQDVWLASELTVNAFTDWILSSSFALEVSENLAERGVDIPASALSFAADNERSVGQIFISWNDPEELVTIAESALDVLANESDDYFPQLGETPAQVTILDEIRVSPQPTPIISRFGALLKLAVAALGGVILAFMAEYFDPFVYRREQMERRRIKVLSTIPRE